MLRQDLGELAYVVSHDVNAPLRPIAWFAERLKEQHGGQLDEQGKRYVNTIIDNTHKAQHLLEALLRYSRIINRGRGDMIEVDPLETLDEARQDLAEKITATNAIIETRSLPTVKADADLLKQLFIVLLSNSMLYVAPGTRPRISIEAKTVPHAVEFIIHDNGIGIDPKYRDSIFRPMKRLHTDEEYAGIGMGLSLARRIVEFHGGRIWLEAALPGGGSRFHFTLSRQGY